jgi:hypothetical protein
MVARSDAHGYGMGRWLRNVARLSEVAFAVTAAAIGNPLRVSDDEGGAR